MVHLQPGRVQWLEYLRCPNFVTHIRSLKSKIIILLYNNVCMQKCDIKIVRLIFT